MRNRKLIYGVGINDAEYIINRNHLSPFYSTWKAMLRRCFADEWHKKYPTYKNATVCQKWLLFSNFRDWMKTQQWEEKELDKDILYPNNKHYSPKTCCFVSKELNKAIRIKCKSNSVWPIGVSFHKVTSKFRAKIKIHNESVWLGLYNTPEEAHIVYLKNKIIYMKSFLPEVSDEIQRGIAKHITILERMAQ